MRRNPTRVALLWAAAAAAMTLISRDRVAVVGAFRWATPLVRIRTPFAGVSFSQLSMEPLIAMDESSSSSHKDDEDEPQPAVGQVDRNGKEFVKGAVVRIVEPMRAYQVQPKGWGTFDSQTKEFVPWTPETGIGFLELPPGLRGVVLRVYNVDEYDASLPVQVKFVPSMHAEEGYDPPLAFLMHFRAQEIEVVVD